MHLCDPNRPKVLNSPAYINSKGEAMGLLKHPEFYWYDGPDGNWRASMWLQVDNSHGYAEHSCIVYSADAFLLAYYTDPEKTLREQFNYTFEPKQRLPKPAEIERWNEGRPKPTLAELGL